MDVINRFLTRFQLPVYVTLSILWTLLCCWGTNVIGFWGVPLAYCGILLIAGFMGSRWVTLLKKPEKLLDDTCDPEPFLEELRRQKNYANPLAIRYNRTALEASALVILGQPEEAYGLLQPLQEKVFKHKMIGTQLCYCTAMVGVCRALDRRYEMENWHSKKMELMGKLKNKRLKQQTEASMPIYMARYYAYRGEYDRSMEALRAVKPEKMYDRVHVAMLCAQNDLAKGETERARAALRFVAENGNKLYIAAEARRLLETL